MDHRTLLNVIQSEELLSERDIALIKDSFASEKYPRKAVLLEPGQIAHHLYFINDGVMRLYSVDTVGNEHHYAFGLKNEFMVDFQSFSTQCPSGNFLICQKATDCLQISCRDCVQLMKEVPPFERFIYKLVEQMASQHLQRASDLLSKTQEQRVADMLANGKSYLQEIPQQYLASYLGMKPESYSRIKRRLSQPQKS